MRRLSNHSLSKRGIFAGRYQRPLRRSAFTLIELLVSMAITLVLVYAIAEFYAYVGKAVGDGRAMIEMGGQLRAVSWRAYLHG